MTQGAVQDVAEQVVASPTYLADIRTFFRQEDVDHMALKGIDLGTYDGVKRNALRIFSHTAPPNPDMPPDPAGQWSTARSQTFRNWIVNGFPMGSAVSPGPAGPGQDPLPTTRLRKDVTALTDPEFETLTTAFRGVMDRDPAAPDSYFAIAGAHGLPQQWCLHHEDRFNPWHRVYLLVFEDALRTVPGCADVTLPYWDIETTLPQRLQQAPFDRYVLPADPGANAQPQPIPGFFPYTTQRFTETTIKQNLSRFGVLDDIATSLKQSVWGAYNTNGYQDFSIQAHDGGHGAIGPTMADQSVAAYDPVFWFFHCNLDRLWLSWQRRVGAETLAGFRSTLTAGADWLTAPLNALPPYEDTATADETIAFPVAYDRLDVPAAGAALENAVGSTEAVRAFSIAATSPVSVRVKDIDRLNIPGSFVVTLVADGQPVAERFFFQHKAPRACPTCRKIGLVNIDFRVPRDAVLDRSLSVRIDVPAHGDDVGTSFPLSEAGNPTVNARLLLEDSA